MLNDKFVAGFLDFVCGSTPLTTTTHNQVAATISDSAVYRITLFFSLLAWAGSGHHRPASVRVLLSKLSTVRVLDNSRVFRLARKSAARSRQPL